MGLIFIGFVLMLIFIILRDLELVPKVYSKIAFSFFLVAGLLRMFIPFLFGEKHCRKNRRFAS